MVTFKHRFHNNQQYSNMKFIKNISHFTNNVKALFDSDSTIVRPQDLNGLMKNQLGSGWADRLLTVKSALHPDTVDKIINDSSSRKFGNLGRLYELMYQISGGSRIAGMLDKRIGAVTRVNIGLAPGDKNNSQSIEATQFLEKYIADIHFKEFLESAMDGKLFGVTAFHNVIKNVGGHYVFEDPTLNQISQSRWHQETNDKDGKFGKLYLRNRDGKKLFIDNPDDVHPYQISKFIYKKKNGYYDTTGIMNRVIRLYILKVWTLTFLANSVERHGKPFLWTTLGTKDFLDADFKSKVQHVLKQFGAERYGIFPDGLEIHKLDTSSSVGHMMHISTIEFCNTEMAISLLGQNLSTEVKGGSYSATQTHMGVEERLTEQDVEWIEEQVNDEWKVPLMKLNYPNLEKAQYPKLSLTPQKDVDMEKLGRGYKQATELIDVPVEEIREKMQIRKPRLKEDADSDATGSDKYDEEVIGPSTRNRNSNAESLLRSLGA